MKRPSSLAVWDGHWGAEPSVAWVVYQTLWRSLPITKPTIIQHHKPKKERDFYIWYQLIFNWSSTDLQLQPWDQTIHPSLSPSHRRHAMQQLPQLPTLGRQRRQRRRLGAAPFGAAAQQGLHGRLPSPGRWRSFWTFQPMVTRWCPPSELSRMEMFKLSWSSDITLIMGLAGPRQGGIAIIEMGLQTDAGLKSQGYLVSRGIHQTIGWQTVDGRTCCNRMPSNTLEDQDHFWNWWSESEHISCKRIQEQIEQHTENMWKYWKYWNISSVFLMSVPLKPKTMWFGGALSVCKCLWDGSRGAIP